MADTLAKIYYNVEHPASFSSLEKLYQAARLSDPSITKNVVQDWLSEQLTYTLHKSRRNRFPRSRTVVTDRNVQWQADLVDLQMYSKFNKNFKYLLTIVDCFSRFARVSALKSKTGTELQKAFEKIFEEETPSAIQTDNGREFKNKEVISLFKESNVDFFTTTDEDIKCSLVERFNRTLKNKMFKIMTKTGKRNYIEYLPAIVKSYNNCVHSSIGLKPSDVDDDDKEKIFQKLYGFKDKREMLIHNRKLKLPKLNVGDLVRIRYQKTVLDRGYYPNWSDHVYEIVKRIKGNPTYYKLKDYENNLIEGRFYEHEIQQVKNPSYRIEKVIKRRTRNGIKECLVKWLNFPSTQNQWIPAENIGEV